MLTAASEAIRSVWSRTAALPVAFFVGVLALGATRVGDEPYWMDEASTRLFVDRPFVDLLRLMWEQEAGMGPYFSTLWLWQHLGVGDVGMRVWSMLGGAAAAMALVVVARRWYGTTVAVIAGLVYVVHPFFLRYLTELRAYSWVMFAVIVAAGATVELVNDPRARWVVTAGVAAGLAVAMLAMSAIWMMALAGAILVAGRLDRAVWRAAIGAGVISVVVAAPFLRVLSVRSGQLGWIRDTRLRTIAIVGRDTIGGYFLLAVLLVPLLAFAVVVLQRRPAHRLHDAVVFAMAAGGAAGLIVVSFVKPLMVARYFSASMPFMALATAVGALAIGRWIAAALPGGSLRAAQVAVLPAVVVVVLLTGRFVARGPFSDEARRSDPRAAVEFVLDRLQPGDLVAIDRPPSSILHYLGERPDIDPGFVARRPSDRGWPRRGLPQIVDQFDDASAVYVFTWVRSTVGAPLFELAAEREVTVYEFGNTFVIELRRP